jgi:hypothetical protein
LKKEKWNEFVKLEKKTGVVIAVLELRNLVNQRQADMVMRLYATAFVTSV